MKVPAVAMTSLAVGVSTVAFFLRCVPGTCVGGDDAEVARPMPLDEHVPIRC